MASTAKKTYWVFEEYSEDEAIDVIATSPEKALEEAKSQIEMRGWADYGSTIVIVAQEMARYEVIKEGLTFTKLTK